MTKALADNYITDSVVSEIVAENYTTSSTISGVRTFQLKNHITEDGYFMELSRLESGILTAFKAENFEVKQINFSKSAPKTVKAWHLHYNQEDVWFVPPESKLLVGLVDVRKNSPTEGTKMKLVMGEGKAELLYIPRGVMHGYRNILNSDSYIIYFVNNYYNKADSDEKRVRWDFYGKDFWNIKKG
jgi:dTDP-4-dehydrorhamnose 3,5-epimerase